jgi:DNA mismatch endonuclease (patch repair protein)
MTDIYDKTKRSSLMSRVRKRDTGPELAVRRIIFSLGYRYRLHVKELPGSPDIVLPRHRKIVLVHGCFWHAHHCRAGRAPSSNTEFWLPKLQKNVERDRRNINDLESLGWKCLIVWQCEIKDLKALEATIKNFLVS